MSSVFQNAADAVKAQHLAEVRLRREMSRKCDWFDPEDVSVWRSEKRRKQRLKTLDRLVKHRRCPVCCELRLGPRQWVINDCGTFAVCKSCHVRNLPKQGVQIDVTEIFTEEIRWNVDADALKQARIDLGLSQREMARRIGMNSGLYCRIETTNGTISENVKLQIEAVLLGKDVDATKM